ncbi:MAG: LicD family protein [Oscillospiraceae bacterium]|nr:LicD family protein [Oscillospiraceae bacterium]
MEKELLRKVQLTQLEIAKEIKRVCEENEIRYFLADGSFLGAVRHGGFIPWDDDMDMGMLRSDYEKFCRIAPAKLKPEYCLQTWYTEPNYGLPFGKVVKRGTVYLENKKSRRLQENGFYVDIFPFDHVPENKLEQERLARRLLSIYRVKLMKSGYQPWMEEDRIVWKKRIGYLYYQLKSLFVSQKTLAKGYDALAVSIPETTMVCEQSALQRPDYYERAWVEELADYTFEGETFKGPKEYDKYLSALYGDYMQLPPEDQRENRHQIVEIDFGKE